MTSHEEITRAYTDTLGLAKDNLRRYRAALEEIAFREACLDRTLRQIAAELEAAQIPELRDGDAGPRTQRLIADRIASALDLARAACMRGSEGGK